MSLVDELRSARWFGGKSRPIAATRIVDRAGWLPDASVCLVEVQYAEGPPDTYVMPERLEDPQVGRALLEQFHGATVRTEAGGALEFRPTHVLASAPRDRTEPIVPLRGEQSNTSIRFGEALILKLFRRLQFGPNPDVEVGWFLTEHSAFQGTPPVAGSLEYVTATGQRASLALLQEFEPNRGDAWTTSLARLRAVLDGGDPADSVGAMARLGRTTAELHLALAGGSGDFSAEPITVADAATWRAAVHAEVDAAVAGLARHGRQVEPSLLMKRAEGIERLVGSEKIRHHGDYHLGQVLERTDGAFVIIDFEGEPAKPLAQRREKRSALRDVAGMLRSFDYARHTAVRGGDTADMPRRRRADDWYAAVRDAYLQTYLATVRGVRPALLPSDIAAPLAALELDKAAYEVLYELNNRPDWLAIPLAALTGPAA